MHATTHLISAIRMSRLALITQVHLGRFLSNKYGSHLELTPLKSLNP